MPQIEYHELRHGAIDPNRARYYWLGGSALGILFAFLTIKTNYDYFDQYYTGFAFWARVVPFFALEAAIIILPLFKGFGNKAQGNVALVFELILVVAALTHTYLVSDASIAKLQAGKTKTEAGADFDKAQSAADRVATSNKELQQNYAKQQENHSRQMRYWNDAAYVARREGRKAPPPPPAPQPPQLQDVPHVAQSVIDNATMSVEMAGQARVSHQTLQRLLFLMIGLVTVSITAMIALADGSRIKDWLLRTRTSAIKAHTAGQPLSLTSYAPPQTYTPVQPAAPVQPVTPVQTKPTAPANNGKPSGKP
ncbi:MAG: hypothetical protein MOB07_23170 [Acidobacteria bacterium]|nr:hypothetical protein [Acidobacteriota bacterium]